MSKRILRIVACTMLVIGAIFFIVALNNPQLSWPWSNTIAYSIYVAYLIVMVVLFVAMPKTIHNLMSRLRQKLQGDSSGSAYIKSVRGVGYKFEAE